MEILGEDKLFDIALEYLQISPYHAVKEIEDVRYTIEEPQVVEILVLEFKNEEHIFIFRYLHDGCFVLRRSFEREKFLACDDLGRPLEQDEFPFEEDKQIVDTKCLDTCEDCLCNTCNKRHFECSERCSECEDFMNNKPLCCCEGYEVDNFL